VIFVTNYFPFSEHFWVNKTKSPMKQNMGRMDKTIRISIAILLGLLYSTGILEGTIGIIAVVLGAIFLLTSFMGFCPLYVPFGISTCKKS
jgi:hypothetical protein